MLLEMFFASIYTGREKRIIVTNIFKFIQQSRQEASKIVWPNRRETTTTTVMVFIMVAIIFVLSNVIMIGLILMVTEPLTTLEELQKQNI